MLLATVYWFATGLSNGVPANNTMGLSPTVNLRVLNCSSRLKLSPSR